MRIHFILSSASLISLAIPAAASAATAESSAATEASVTDSASDDPIIVEGQRSSYGAPAITTATKTDTPVRNIPQALTIITKAQIDDQALRSIGDLLTFVPGASAGTGESNRDQIVLRGNNTTADFFINGVRDDVQYFRDFYNVERVDSLKGWSMSPVARTPPKLVVPMVNDRLASIRDCLVTRLTIPPPPPRPKIIALGPLSTSTRSRL